MVSEAGRDRRVVITGANRGIGFEFVRQYLADGWEVVATTRSLDHAYPLRNLADEGYQRLQIHSLDVSKAESIGAFADSFTGVPIDVLINNAGGLGRDPTNRDLAAMTFENLDYGLWLDLFLSNTIGAVRLAESLVNNISASQERKMAFISSTAGSIAEGGHPALAYGTSKAALNKAATVIAEQVKKKGIAVVCLCPGRVKTRMGFGARIETADSVSGMRRLLETLTVDQSGCFLRYNGETVQW